MRSPLFAIALFIAVTAAAATPPKTVAPATIPHPMAMYLNGLSKDGKQQVTFRSAAVGTCASLVVAVRSRVPSTLTK